MRKRKPRNGRFSVGVNYSPAQQIQLRAFCSIINERISDFAGEALDHYIHHRMNAFPPERKEAISHLLVAFKKQLKNPRALAAPHIAFTDVGDHS